MLRTPLRTRIIPSRDSPAGEREASKVGRVENSSSTSAVYTGLVNPRVHHAHGRPAHPHLPRHIASPGIALPAEEERWLPLNEGELQTGRPSSLPHAHSTLLATHQRPMPLEERDHARVLMPHLPQCHLAPMPPSSLCAPASAPSPGSPPQLPLQGGRFCSCKCAQPSSHRNNVPAALGLNCLHMFNTAA